MSIPGEPPPAKELERFIDLSQYPEIHKKIKRIEEGFPEKSSSLGSKPDHEHTIGPGRPNWGNSAQNTKVCPVGKCHWIPCGLCEEKLGDCGYHRHHIIHLFARTGIIIRPQVIRDAEGEHIVTMSELCECHPRRKSA